MNVVPLLLPQHNHLIEGSAIAADVAKERGYRSITKKLELKNLGFAESQQIVPAFLIPIHNVHGEIALYQIRPDSPRIIKSKPLKYETPKGSQMVLDVPPRCRAQLSDPAVPLFVTEGVRKADAAVSHGLSCVDVLGVWNWRGSNDHGGKTALADWESIALNGRKVYIVFDSDVMTKASVHAALSRLKSFLESRGANVAVIYLPAGPNNRKVGLDDYLADGNPAQSLLGMARLELLAVDSDEPSDEHGYFVKDGATYYRKSTNNGDVDIELANFSATITEERSLDNGQDVSCSFALEGQARSGGSFPLITVPAADFRSMSWVSKYWGARAIVAAGATNHDRLREAIQRTSGTPTRTVTYTHTGWRTINGQPVFLTSSGAIGGDAQIQLSTELKRYRLPPNPEGLREAMQASLRLLEVAPLAVTVPLYAAIFRAPLAPFLPVDFALWLVGLTGSLKSTMAALFLSHFGEFAYNTLPGSWLSTANQLEMAAFNAKDLPFVIDDFAPTAVDRRELDSKAARIIRAQGNLAGRGRLRSDLTERPTYPPRGLIISTGEDLPVGRSVLARLLSVEFTPGCVDTSKLTYEQSIAAVLPHAMTGYLRWIARQYDSISEQLLGSFNQARQSATTENAHLRIPSAAANLFLGFDCAIQFAREVGACSTEQANELREASWSAIVSVAARQSAEVDAARPENRFLETLVTLHAQRRLVLLAKTALAPELRPDQFSAWIDDEYLLIDDQAAYHAVSKFLRDSGDQFPLSRKQLRKDLVTSGISFPEPGRHDAAVRVSGSVQRLLRLRLSAISALLGHPAPFGAEAVTKVTTVTTEEA